MRSASARVLKRSLLVAENLPEPRQTLLPSGALKDIPIDDTARDTPMLEFEHRRDIGSTVAGEALVGPAERVRRQQDVVQRQDRVIRIGRLLFQDIEPGPGDQAVLQNLRQRLLVHDRSTRRIDEISGRLHETEPIRIDDMVRFGRQRNADRQHVGTAEHVLEAHQLDAQIGCCLLVRVWIVRDELHVEGLQQAKYFGADVADTERAESAAYQPDTHVVRPARIAGGGLPGQAVLDHDLAGQRQHEGEDRDGDGPAYAVGCYDERDARVRASLGVDGVVSDAETRDHAEAAAFRNALRTKAMRQQYQRVEIFELPG